MNDKESTFTRQIAAKASKKLRAQRDGTHNAWFGLGMFGVIGWSVSVPTLLGALLGIWWDIHHPSTHSWTLALLVAGLIIGCANAWYWVAQQEEAIRRVSGADRE